MTKEIVLADQASSNPSRKMVTTLITAPGFALAIDAALTEVWPQLVPDALSGPGVTALISYAVAIALSYVFGYNVRDVANVPLR